ncbi:MAG: bifunctional folylpolyglutamate synthase/dihydrofolate synthase, partial [Maricaulaceae bacterium]
IEIAASRKIIGETADTLTNAIDRAITIGTSEPIAPEGSAPPRVLICGSLYLAGEVLRQSGF